MSYTLAGKQISSAFVRLPRYGLSTATVAVAGPLTLAVGERAELVVGDLSLACSVLSGTTFAGQASYQLVVGAGRWSAAVNARAHRSDGGVTVAEVAAALATDAGELGVVLEAGAERPLGYAWTRRAGVASDALRQLVGEAWWTAPDGWTHIGPRPTGTTSSPNLRVLSYEPALRRASVALTDDKIAQVAPGRTLVAADLPAPLEIGDVSIRLEADVLEVDVLGERPPSELMAGLLGLVAARARLAAPQLYQVTDDAQQRTSGRPAGPAAASLPDHDWLDRAYGLPGVSAELAPGALVLVALVDGHPGAPRVTGYLPGVLPVTLGLDASSAIVLGGAGAKKVALADAVDLEIGRLVGAINALRAAQVPPLPPIAAAVSCAAEKVSAK